MKLAYSYLNRTVHLYWVSLLMLLAISFNTAMAAAPPVNSVIGNQAVATYNVAGGGTQTAVSNLVQTIVLQIADFSMTADNNLKVLQAKQVIFAHQVTNSGNGADFFELAVTTPQSTDVTKLMTLSNVAIYTDANSDGLPDNITPITRTPLIQPGSSFSFVVVGLSPASAAIGDVATLTVTANSNFNKAVAKTNTDIVTIVTGAVVVVEKTMVNMSDATRERTKSAFPEDTIRVRLAYKNTGNATSFFELSDVLDPGLEYVPNSAKYVVGGTVKQITAADTTDVSLIQPATDNNRTITFKFTRPLAVETLVNPVLTFVEFEVKVARLQLPKLITNSAKIRTGTTLETITTDSGTSNVATINVLLRSAFDINSSLTLGTAVIKSTTDFSNVARTVTRGVYTAANDTDIYASDTVPFQNLLVNLGNGVDTFNLHVEAVPTDLVAAAGVTPNGTANYQFPKGTQFFFYDDNNTIPLTDTNGDGRIDTGPVNPIGNLTTPRFVYVRIVLPPDVITGKDFNYRIKVIATSINNGSEQHVYNVIKMVKDSTVDLVQIIGNAESGVGPGPGTTPVQTIAIDAGASTDVNLRIKHTGGETLYRLEYSTDANFTRVNTLPDGWSITFYSDIAKTKVITSIPVLRTIRPATGNVIPVNYNFNATIATPKGASAGNNDVYFRVVSVRLNIRDSLFDRITINTTHDLNLGESQTGQVYEGSSITYLHVLTNNGNVTETSGAVTVANEPTSGWSATLYLDLDGDGKVSPGDPEFTNITQLNSINGGLKQKAQFPLLLVVQPLSGSSVGSEVRTTIKVSVANTTYFTEVTDLTSVSSGFITIQKMQLLDKDCNINSPESNNQFTSLNILAAPSQCIIYKVTITNTATESAVTAVNLTDKVPAFTSFDGTFGTSGYRASGTVPAATDVTVPPNGTSGSSTNSNELSIANIVVKWPTLQAKATADIFYRVKVDQ